MLSIYLLRLCSKWTQVITWFDVTSRSWICHICETRPPMSFRTRGKTQRTELSRRDFGYFLVTVFLPTLLSCVDTSSDITLPRFLNFSISLFPVSYSPGSYLSFFCLHSRRSPRVLRLTSHRIVISHPYTIKYIT